MWGSRWKRQVLNNVLDNEETGNRGGEWVVVSYRGLVRKQTTGKSEGLWSVNGERQETE